MRLEQAPCLDVGSLKIEPSCVIPAKAGTHNHRRMLRRKVSATVPKMMGHGVWVPAFRRDDERVEIEPSCVVAAKAGTHNHRRMLRRKVSATVPKMMGHGVWVPAFRRDDGVRASRSLSSGAHSRDTQPL